MHIVYSMYNQQHVLMDRFGVYGTQFVLECCGLTFCLWRLEDSQPDCTKWTNREVNNSKPTELVAYVQIHIDKRSLLLY